jgi:hypothetical protein
MTPAAFALAALLLAAAAPAARGAPLPPGGQFEFNGAPAFGDGLFVSQDGDTTFARVVFNSSLGSVRFSPGGGVVTVVGAFTSHACVDDSTYYAMLTGMSYPSGEPLEGCMLFRVAAVGEVQAATPLADGRCPDLAELPPLADVGASAKLHATGAFVNVSSAARVASAIATPAPLRCVNATGAPPVVAPTFAKPVPDSRPSPCAALPSPGGPDTAAGLWLGADGDLVALDAGTDWGVVYFPAGGEPLQASLGTTLEHECLGPREFASASAVQHASANGTAASSFSCKVKAQTGAGAMETRPGAGATAGVAVALTAVPGTEVAAPEGTPTCAAAAPEAAPEAAPASAAPALPTPRALAAVAAAVALFARA